ncbi:hypothetical protein DESUT3_21460 [Desulfuromonas versatilis]|uniref:Uncharacterized protein n=1 Tax=Desulfuromonas versatilis TaxID=2802975 RepID=A0ABN6DYY3_9BACT|nr:hypothetical protein [Desulfuromonas versatilis]BCR05077.1 hypothetical protein DESUT3_21460 [Desulfuromonas versatilis]
MKMNGQCIAILLLFLGLTGNVYGFEAILVAKAQLGDLYGLSTVPPEEDGCQDRVRAEPAPLKNLELPGNELNDVQLGSIRGKAIGISTPELPGFSASAIILWDEPGVRGSEKFQRANGASISSISIQGR